jgi:hydroxymethylglutaryl-CoA synthase
VAKTGIVSFGAYVPMTRAVVDGSEKAVAGHDEDSITMAAAAAADCLTGFERSAVDAVIFASTTSPYAEKQAAALLARALDLRRDIRAVDLAGSLRAGTSGLRTALDMVEAGSASSALVIAADARLGPLGSRLESSFGDGAAAFLIGSQQPVAHLEAARAVSDEILDVWRTDGERTVESWEERFVVQHGYRDNLVEAVRALFAAFPDAGRFDRAALYAPDPRSHAEVVKALRIDRERVQPPLFGKLGNTGAAFAPMLLAAALETAKPGQRLLVASYGDGAEALSFSTTEHLDRLGARRGVAGSLKNRRVLSEAAYATLRRAEGGEGGGISATVHWRDRDDDISFKAAACRNCKTLQYPRQRVCYRCFARDAFDPVRLSDRRGKVLAYTFDHFFPSPEPPTVATVVEVEGGARAYVMMCDATQAEVRRELPVEFAFRKVHDAGGKPNYFWKARPLRQEVPS